MADKAKAIPDGYHTVTPYLTVKNSAEAIEFYKRAFGAEEMYRMPGPDGKSTMHAEIKIGTSILMLSDEWPEANIKSPQTLGSTTVNMHVYVQDVDAAFQKAVAAGATTVMPVTDMFWGDRYGKLTDPYGHSWGISTHTKDMTPQEIGEAAKEWMAKMPKSC
jgi:uncharacterized glyoxalase superfamily protein PhnB